MSALPEAVDVLIVADAAVMPRLPRINTNLPTLMLAEKIADTPGAAPA